VYRNLVGSEIEVIVIGAAILPLSLGSGGTKLIAEWHTFRCNLTNKSFTNMMEPELRAKQKAKRNLVDETLVPGKITPHLVGYAY